MAKTYKSPKQHSRLQFAFGMSIGMLLTHELRKAVPNEKKESNDEQDD